MIDRAARADLDRTFQQPLQIWFESLLDAQLPICRYPRYGLRRFVRWLLRRGSVRGQELVFLNLVRGLDRLGVRYTVNDYGRARRHPDELVCLVGKPHLLQRCPRESPLLLGSSIYSHPSDAPDLFEQHDVRRILVPGEWMRRMCEPYWGERVHSWPVGIDTEHWYPAPDAKKDVDVLVYDKLHWPEHRRTKRPLIDAAIARLSARGLTVARLQYGHYLEQDYHALLGRSRAMLFLCEHETQGIAYLEAMSRGVPLLAWSGTHHWEDPDYYPHRVVYSPVTCVPYWDERGGWRMDSFEGTLEAVEPFLQHVRAGAFSPRDYVVENLTLERAALAYLRHVSDVRS